jgi:hypothetical protein
MTDAGARVVDKRKSWEARVEMAIFRLPKEELGAYEKLVYAILCGHADRDRNARLYVGTIADEASCSDRQVRRALASLEACNLLARKAQVSPDGQSCNVYEVYGAENYTRVTDSHPPMTDSHPPLTVSHPPHDCQSGPNNVFEQPLVNKDLKPPLTPQGGGCDGEPFELEAGRAARDGKRDGSESRRNEAICGLYNEILPGLPKAEKVTESRRRAFRARIRDDPARKDLDWWRRYFLRVRECPFLLGANDKGWLASLDWVIRDGPMQKILEGVYSARAAPGGRSAAAAAAQEKYTGEGGEVDARALLRDSTRAVRAG